MAWDFWKERKKKVTAYFVFGAIIMVFVFLRYNDWDTKGGGGYAARVNNKIITVFEFKEAVDRLTQYYSQMFGGQFDVDAQRRGMVRRSALEQLVSREVTSQEAQKAGVWVTDMEIKDTLVGVPTFQKDGRFRRELYEGFLNYRRMQAAQFEDVLRRDLQVEKTRRLFEQSIVPPRSEAVKEALVRENKINLKFAKLERELAIQKIAVSEADVANFAKGPEAAKRMQEYFNTNRAKYQTEEQVKARHILIKVAPGDAKADEAAKKKIEDLAKRAQKEDFAKLAKEFSEDTGSQTQGGDLGFFGRGRMVEPFEKAAFALEVGKLSEPVKSSFGYHLIKVEDKKAAKTSELKDVESEIAKTLVREDRYKAILADLEKSLAARDEKAIEKTLKDLGGTWDETGLFSLGEEMIPKMGRSEVVSQALGGLSEANPLTNKLLLEGDKAYILKLKEQKLAAAPTDEKVREIVEELGGGQSRELYSKWVESMVKSARVERNQALVDLE